MLTFGPKVPLTDFDENLYQGHDPICAICCQGIILRDFGIQIPKEELTAYAEAKGWYDGKGTKTGDVGHLLETCHVGTHSQHCDSIHDLIDELRAGHRVIVGVDVRELKAEVGSPEYEFFRNLPHANHALIVTGIQVDPQNPENTTVVLTDPASGSVLEHGFSKFAHSWGDSGYFMVATDEAAPYQYNAATGSMEVSNFATDFTLKEFPFHNEFTDIWKVDELGYVPYYAEDHLTHIDEGIFGDEFSPRVDGCGFDGLDPIPVVHTEASTSPGRDDVEYGESSGTAFEEYLDEGTDEL